jgi:hypothetical protein
MAKICGVIVLLMVGCSSAVESQPEVKTVDTDSFISSVNVQAKAIATTLAAQKLTGEMTLENTQAIITKLNKLEASLASPKPQQSGGDPASALQPSAKNANDSQTSTKIVAQPAGTRRTSDGTVLRWNIEGNWNPTILETSAHLREHGINTDGMTHQEMADIHASIHEGKPVAMKSETVRYVSRGANCPNGQCPTSSTRYVRRTRR